jgi:hypothetical protein
LKYGDGKRHGATDIGDGPGKRGRISTVVTICYGNLLGKFVQVTGSGFAGEYLVFLHQLLFGLHIIRVKWNTVDRAYLDTLRCLVVTDTLGTQVRIDHIDLITSTDRLVRALRFTYIAIDAFICNH